MTGVVQSPPPAVEAEVVPAAATKSEPMVIDVNNVTAAQRVAILRSVHGFFSNYDRVPGALAEQWGNALNALAVVVNSETQLLQKAAEQVLE